MLLEELNVDNNKITSIHRSLFLLPQLTVFSARNNQYVYRKHANKIPEEKKSTKVKGVFHRSKFVDFS